LKPTDVGGGDRAKKKLESGALDPMVGGITARANPTGSQESNKKVGKEKKEKKKRMTATIKKLE